MAQEAAWESVESAWAVMGLLALVGFRVMSKRSRNILLLPPANINIERFLQTFALSWLAGGLTGNDKLLQPLVINLVNTNGASNEIPIFFVRKTASVRGPSQLARRFRVIGIVNEIALDSRIRRKRLLFID